MEQSWNLENWKYRIPKFQREDRQDAMGTVSWRDIGCQVAKDSLY